MKLTVYGSLVMCALFAGGSIGYGAADKKFVCICYLVLSLVWLVQYVVYSHLWKNRAREKARLMRIYRRPERVFTP